MKKTRTKAPSKKKPTPPSNPLVSHLHNSPPTIHQLSPTSGSLDPSSEVFHDQSSSYVLQQLQNVRPSTFPACGRCYQQINMFYVGGYCTQCGVSICWSCWSTQPYSFIHCNNCYSYNCTQYVQ